MSTSHLRKRLDRLERSGSTVTGEGDSTLDFHIDLTLAKSLRDDCKRVWELRHPSSAAEIEEEKRLNASIAERARAISCPAGYGVIQERKDSERLNRLRDKRGWGKGLTDAEDAEEAQLRARVCAYYESPEGRARNRLLELQMTTLADERSTAEQQELDRLVAIYPHVPFYPEGKDPLQKSIDAWGRAAEEWALPPED